MRLGQDSFTAEDFPYLLSINGSDIKARNKALKIYILFF